MAIQFNGNLTKDLTQSMYKINQTETVKLTKEAIIHAMILQEFLDWTKRDWKINAWYRGSAYNKKVGGISTSNHLKGTATDVSFGTKFDYSAKFNKYSDKYFSICDKYGVVGEFGLYAGFYHIGSYITYQKKHCKFDKRSGKTVYL